MEVFFYGLFMDVNLLRSMGIEIKNLRIAVLAHHKLVIGQKASLLPNKGSSTYGILMQIGEKDLKRLYEQKEVSAYKPQHVVVDSSEEKVNAVCYLISAEQMVGRNSEYAEALWILAKSLDFPEDYLQEIKSQAQSSID